MQDSENTGHPALIPSLPEKVAVVVGRINGYLLTFLAFFLVICVVWQVVSRYISPQPSTVTDELARFTFMWIGLLGAAQASAQKKHLAIDLLAMKLKGQARKILHIFIECAIIAFASLVMIWGGMALTMRTFSSQQITPALQWPMGYVYMVVPVAGILMVFFALVEIYACLYGRQTRVEV